MARNAIDISINEKEFAQSLRELQRKEKALTPKFMKSMLRRRARPIESAMKRGADYVSRSGRLSKQVSITMAKGTGGNFGGRIGVIRTDDNLFPDFTAQALASVLEYGTVQRYRNLKAGVFITGRVSTGKVNPMPYLRPAWDQNVGQFMRDVEDSVTKKVERAK